MAVIEDGEAMLIMGGTQTFRHVLSDTQIVRPGQPTQRGPRMTGGALSHCSKEMQDGEIMVTGGNRAGGYAQVEIFNFTKKEWRSISNMKQGRMLHNCAKVLLDPANPNDPNILSGVVTNTSVLSVLVAGGKIQHEVNPN